MELNESLRPATTAEPESRWKLSDSDLNSLLEGVFRRCNNEEIQELEQWACGRGNLVACLESFLGTGDAFAAGNFLHLAFMVSFRFFELLLASHFTPEELKRTAEEAKRRMEIGARRQAADLLGRSVNNGMTAPWQAATDLQPHKPGALLTQPSNEA